MVDEAHQRQGVGTMLVNAALKAAEEIGCGLCKLDTYHRDAHDSCIPVITLACLLLGACLTGGRWMW